MVKCSIALITTLIAGWALLASATTASAHRAGCNCEPGSTSSTYYKTIHPAKFFTRYHDTTVNRHVQRVHRVVNVTRVQPIIHIHDITRIHHRTIVHTVNAYSHMTEQLTPIRYIQRSTQNFYDCNCGR